ncbi:hypothetical protein [Microbacterium sp. YY-01]|uniref:hypothetical protein n=1 Tax=Microbacterium sp. YY-01 TaxID=3421634 RepID=UPI003D1731F0
MKRSHWWLLGGGLVVVALGAAAAVVIPQVLHQQRVAQYNETVEQINTAFAQTQHAQLETDRAIVLYALQLDEAHAFQAVVEELAGYSDHYFSTESLAALAGANESLLSRLADDELEEAEHDLIAQARSMIDEHGYVWQTDFLNLDIDAVEQLLSPASATTPTPVADDQVTTAVLEDARDVLEAALEEKQQVDQQLTVARERAQSLIDELEAALVPLTQCAFEAPDQAEQVLVMYPDAAVEAVTQLRDSAAMAAASVDAKVFTTNDDYAVVPVIGEPDADKPSFAATDSWRATVIATHLTKYSNAITAAWITDAGSLEDALGFNPYLPFFALAAP